MNTLVKTLSALLASAALACAFSVQAEDKAAANTAPVGEVCKQGEACASAAAASTGGAAKSGEQVYNSSCNACHGTGAAGAPKLGDAGAWAARLSARSLDGLYKSGISGYNGMPPKGLCMTCSDDEIKGAVDYMLEKSK